MNQIFFFFRVSLSKFFLEALFLSWVKEAFTLGWEWNMMSQVFQNRATLRLGLAAWLSREFQPQGNWTANCPILSCNALAGVMLQLLACLACVPPCSCESPARSSCESMFFLHTHEHFFTLSHSLPLQESHLNTGLLIAEIQANLVRNKANKMVD